MSIISMNKSARVRQVMHDLDEDNFKIDRYSWVRCGDVINTHCPEIFDIFKPSAFILEI